MRRLVTAGLAAAMLVGGIALAGPAAGAQSRTVGTVVIANGWSAADSAVAAAVAAARTRSSSSAVVLYSAANELSARTRSFIEARRPARVVLVGGEKALSAEVASTVAGLTGTAPERITGADRYETAANAVAQTASVFIVANGHSPADTGVAAALAALERNAAVLLATTTSLTPATERVIARRKPRQVIFVGGAKVLADSLKDRVRELAPSAAPVTRRSGSSRTDTAAAAAPSWAKTLVIANGWRPADASVAAALAAITDVAAVLYSQKDALSKPTSDRIAALQPNLVVLVGGTSALSTSLHRHVHCLAPGATLRRVSGSDRIDTAARAARGTQTTIGTNFECGGGGGGGSPGGGGGGGGGGNTGNGGGPGNGGNGGDPVPQPAPGKPSAPTVANGAASQSLSVSWTAPDNDGPDITDYDLQQSNCTATSKRCTDSPQWSNWTTLTGNQDPGNTTSITITGLTDGSAYRFRVRATNSSGSGDWSDPASAVPYNPDYSNPNLAQQYHDPEPYPGANPIHDLDLVAPKINGATYNPDIWEYDGAVWRDDDGTKTNVTTGVGDSVTNFCRHVGAPKGDPCKWHLHWALYTCHQMAAGVTAQQFTTAVLGMMTWESGRPNGTERRVRAAVAAGVRTCAVSPKDNPVAAIWNFDAKDPTSHWATEVASKE